MKLTIIPADKFMSIDGVGKVIDYDFDPNIHAVQWNGEFGFVEQIKGGSRRIDDLEEFYEAIDIFNAPEPEPEPPTLEEAIQVKLSELGDFRYQKEMAGFNLNGQIIATDDRSKTLLMGARIEAAVAIDKGEDYSINWKANGGFITLTATEIVAISNAVRAYIQACFNIEKYHDEIISALSTVPEVLEYDFTSNWP